MMIQDAADYKGCSHIHSTYSDGSGTMEEIVQAARDSGLDFIIMTDHNTLAPKEEGWEGWRDDVLVVVGTEASPRGLGHCVALGIDRCRNYRHLPPEAYLQDVRDQHGMAFVAHPLGKSKPFFQVRLAPWERWDEDGFIGMEIWSYMHDWIDKLTPLNFCSYYAKPHDKIAGPNPKVLAIWDELTKTRKMVGISGLDVHAHKARLFPKINVFPYAKLFKTIRTHIIAPRFSRDDACDVERVEQAHREGRCYIAFDRLADATGFGFVAQSGEDACHMGATLKLVERAALTVRAPRPCELRLLRHGETVANADADSLEYVTEQPGAYRVEARLDGRPWVFTNPIYVA